MLCCIEGFTSNSLTDVSIAASAAQFFMAMHATTMFLKELQFWKDGIVKSAASVQDNDFHFSRKWCKWSGKWNNRISQWRSCERMMTVTAASCCLTSMLSAFPHATLSRSHSTANYWHYESGVMPQGVWITKWLTIMAVCKLKCSSYFCLSHFQVYIIKVSWSDGSTEVIYRRYSKFFDLQVSTCASVCMCNCV